MEVERRCMICRTVRPRSEMVRFVRTQLSKVELDLTQVLHGRGVHVCSNSSCIEEAFKKGRLARGLRVAVDPDDAERLRKRALEYLLSNGEWS